MRLCSKAYSNVHRQGKYLGQVIQTHTNRNSEQTFSNIYKLTSWFASFLFLYIYPVCISEKCWIVGKFSVEGQCTCSMDVFSCCFRSCTRSWVRLSISDCRQKTYFCFIRLSSNFKGVLFSYSFLILKTHIHEIFLILKNNKQRSK